MKICLFYHSLLSDWNHGNAHFLRGVSAELLARGHEVRVFEPREGWSLSNLRREHGEAPVQAFHEAYPQLRSTFFDDPSGAAAEVRGADLVIVHEWNDPELVQELGRLRRCHDFRLLFHDTHHRAVTAPEQMARYDLGGFDGVLAYGNVLRDLYLERRWIRRAWTWHEAADTRVFQPHPEISRARDVVWIGNWGDEERTAELREFFIEPVRELQLDAVVHGVRYPEEALRLLRKAGIEYRGWLPNFRVPEIFARFKATLHVPRRPYVEALPGIPTIRPFEALACGIPLLCSPWSDTENLFTQGSDFLKVEDGDGMREQLQHLLAHPARAEELAAHGLRTIRARHTCAHRVDELLEIYEQLK